MAQPAVGKPEASRFVFFFGQGGKGQMSSEHSGRITDSPAVGNRVHVTQEENKHVLVLKI